MGLFPYEYCTVTRQHEHVGGNMSKRSACVLEPAYLLALETRRSMPEQAKARGTSVRDIKEEEDEEDEEEQEEEEDEQFCKVLPANKADHLC